MRKQYPKAFEPAAMELIALAGLQDIDAIEKIVDEYADVEQVRLWGQVTLAEAATAKGDTDKAGEILSVLAGQQDHMPPFLRRATAQLLFFQDPVPDGTLTLATGALNETRAAQMEDRAEAERTAASVYVLALIEAGQLPEAIQALHAMPAVDPDSRPNRFDKLALGWIADKCDLHEHAKKLFQEIEQGKECTTQIPCSTLPRSA